MNTRNKLEYIAKQKREGNFGRDSLLSSFKSAMMTACVGEIASVEEHFGFLWNHGSDKRTDAQQRFFEIWSRCRDEMFDKMNCQLRSLLNNVKGAGQ